jgi:ABC-type glycerol-3-phosphate transport system substrate-binding protein
VINRSDKIILNANPVSAETIYEKSYKEYLDGNGYDGELADDVVSINLNTYTTEGELATEVGAEGILTEGDGKITWNFNVKESGFYNLKMGYIALPGTTSDIQRKIYIDNEICYDDLSQIVLKRWWEDETITKKNHNEIRPDSSEIYQNTEWYVEDYNRRNGAPLLFYLSVGTHTVTFETIKEPLEITGLTFESYQIAKPYEEKVAELKNTYKVYDGDYLSFQAERTDNSTESIIKSASSVSVKKNYSDSTLVPYHAYYTVYNTIGGDSWQNPGDSITWNVNVKEDGLYKLNFKGRQNTNRGVTSYRRLYVNNEIPYAEMNAIGFEYSTSMNNYTVADEDGNAYLFYLKQGVNSIRLENVMGPFGGIISEVEESVKNLNDAYLSVIQLTGQAPDKFIDYQIAKKVPDFAKVMADESKRLYHLVDAIVEITGEKGERTTLLEKMAMQAEKLSKKPEGVVNELGQLKNNISAVGTWLVEITKMPLELDSLSLSAPEDKLPDATDRFFAGAYNGTLRFLSTFFIKSNSVSNASEKENDSLTVWVASYGKEHAQIIQNLIDNSFTANTDIHVDLQLIPADVVLRAALTGNGPDVVIGLSQSTEQDFAMRGASVNLSELEGYKEVTDKYYPSTLNTSTYGSGVYGLPEQANFLMMFYRQDILGDLGLKAPNTWKEFIEMLPVLQENNYNAYIPNAYANDASGNLNFYQSLVYQYKGTVYEGEGDEYGTSSGLESDQAMGAFKDYTDLFTNYGLNVQVDFSNRFRTGEVPIGIINYTTFNQLEIFAPEIKGQWTFTTIPGMENEDGTINKTVIVDTIQSVIMSQTDHLDAAWEFLKWWSETDTQLKFTTTVESVMGSAARIPSANPEVLEQLPWSNTELKELLSQFDTTIGIQAVPGYYMTNRMISYSFSNVVSNNSNPRETLYLNIKSIDKELKKKHEELMLLNKK